MERKRFRTMAAMLFALGTISATGYGSETAGGLAEFIPEPVTEETAADTAAEAWDTVPESSWEDFIFTVSDQRATITGYQGEGGKVRIPENFGGAERIYIDRWAFSERDDITRVYLPENVCDIGAFAFAYCDGLEEVYVRGNAGIGESAFEECGSLRKADLSGATDISEAAFRNCTNLSEVSFSSSLEAIEDEAFRGCKGLKEVNLSETSVRRIGEYAFSNCSGLTSLSLPATLNSVEESLGDFTGMNSTAFVGCWSLGDVTVAEGNPDLEEDQGNLYAGNALITRFPGYENADVVIRDGTERICSYAFLGNKKMKSVTIPDSVTQIGYQAFWGCGFLEEVSLPDSVVELNSRAFYRCTSLKSVVLGNGVTWIPVQTFDSCKSLETVTFGSNVTDVGMCAFRYCTSLKSMELPDTVNGLGQGAFAGCTALEKVSLPDQVAYYVYGVITPTSTSTVFEDCVNVVITFRGREYTYEQAEELDKVLGVS